MAVSGLARRGVQVAGTGRQDLVAAVAGQVQPRTGAGEELGQVRQLGLPANPRERLVEDAAGVPKAGVLSWAVVGAEHEALQPRHAPGRGVGPDSVVVGRVHAGHRHGQQVRPGPGGDPAQRGRVETAREVAAHPLEFGPPADPRRHRADQGVAQGGRPLCQRQGRLLGRPPSAGCAPAVAVEHQTGVGGEGADLAPGAGQPERMRPGAIEQACCQPALVEPGIHRRGEHVGTAPGDPGAGGGGVVHPPERREAALHADPATDLGHEVEAAVDER
jgi:hypothetical protein